MPEISSAPAYPSPTSLYPQPPSQQGALSNPAQVLDLIGSITKNQMLQNELRARNALGQAYSGAVQPDNTFDMSQFMGAIRGNPDAAWLAGEAIPHVMGIAKAQSDLLFGQNQTALSVLGSLPKNATDEEIRHAQAALSRIYKGQNAALIEGWASNLKGLRGKDRADAIAVYQNLARGPEAIAGRVGGPPGPAGEPRTYSSGDIGLSEAGRQGSAVGLPPGEAESQASAAAGAASLEATGAKTAQVHADLENLRQLNKDIPLQGPTAEWEKKLNQVGARLGIGVTMTADQLKKSEEFDKIANQLSLNQSTLFHGSDAGLHTVVAANPNLGMSRYGREGVIDMLHGNQDAIDRTRQLWLEARKRGAPANSYNQFVNEASKAVDPRVFQFNRMSRENQQKFLSDMDPADLPDFEARYQDAIRRKWVKPLKGDKSSALGTSPLAAAKQGLDASGNPGWFVPDPNRPGKHLQVMTS